MNCLIYSRVSTEEQAEKGRSIDDQIRICEKYAKENGYSIAGIYKDPGKSASTMNRPGLQDLLLRCKEDKSIEAVLVQDTDRLARNTYDHLQIKFYLKKHNVKLISVSQPMLSDDSPEAEFIDVVIAGANALQSRITGRKTAKVLEERVKEGWWHGWCPLGYKNARADGKNIVVLDKERAPYIKRAFELYSTGNYSVEALNDLLYQKGLRTRDGRKLSRSIMTNILKNPFYTGKMLYKGKIYQGKHQPITSEELFNLCQQVIAEHNQNAIRRRKYQYLLRGFLYCGECGSRIYAEKHKKPSGLVFDYYFCQNCGQSYSKVDEIEKQVAESFKIIQLPQRLIDKIVAKAKEILNQTHQEVDKDRQLLYARKIGLEKRRNVLETKLLDGVIDNDTYKHNTL